MSSRGTDVRPRRRQRAADAPTDHAAAGPVPARALTAAQLRTELRRRLGDGDRTALWADHGDRLLVHASQTAVALHAEGLVATLAVEADESGPCAVEVRLALAHGDEEPGLLAVTDERAAGHPEIAARWGGALQDAIFEALLDLLDEAAEEAGARPAGLRMRRGRLELAVAGERR